jgi:hypothetical protein
LRPGDVHASRGVVPVLKRIARAVRDDASSGRPKVNARAHMPGWTKRSPPYSRTLPSRP